MDLNNILDNKVGKDRDELLRGVDRGCGGWNRGGGVVLYPGGRRFLIFNSSLENKV